MTADLEATQLIGGGHLINQSAARKNVALFIRNTTGEVDPFHTRFNLLHTKFSQSRRHCRIGPCGLIRIGARTTKTPACSVTHGILLKQTLQLGKLNIW